jgi:glycosyltransferase involved in cell wall biosynthesis
VRVTYVGFGDFYRYAGMKQLYHFAQGLCRQGHQAQILVAGSASSVASMGEPPLAEVVEMAFSGPVLAGHVRQRVLDFRPDVLHVWTPRQVPALAGWQLQRSTGARLILDHEDDEGYLARIYARSQGRRLSRGLRRLARPLARLRGHALPWLAPLRPDGSARRMAQDRLASALLRPQVRAHTAISPALVAYVGQTWPGKPVHLLYPGADLSLFHPQRDGSRVRQQHRLEDRPLLVYSGTMSLAIFAYFCEVMRLVVAAVPEATLLVLGNDEFRVGADSMAERLGLRKRVLLIGMVPYSQVPDYLAAADVLLQHPLDIGNDLRLPAKLPEYLAMGKPLVMYSQGIGEILQHGVHALKVTTSAPEEMSNCILSLVHDPSLGSDLGRRARELARQSFDWDTNCERLVEIYQTVSNRAEGTS